MATKLAKKTPTKKIASKKAPAKKVAVKKTPAKKVAVKKTPVKKAAAKKVSPSAVKSVVKGKVKAKAKTAVIKTVRAKSAPVQKAKPVKAVKKVIAKKPAVAKAPKKPLTEAELLRDAALKVLDERQAEDIITVDMRGRSIISDFVIVATGRSGRQQAAIANYLREAFFKLGVKRVRAEGLEQGDWVLIDGGDVIVHLFKPEVRSYYKIEDIWTVRKVAV